MPSVVFLYYERSSLLKHISSNFSYGLDLLGISFAAQIPSEVLLNYRSFYVKYDLPGIIDTI